MIPLQSGWRVHLCDVVLSVSPAKYGSCSFNIPQFALLPIHWAFWSFVVLAHSLVLLRSFSPTRYSVRPSPFFLCLASSDRPRFSCFQKKSYAEGNDGNDTIFTLIWNIRNFLLYRFLAFSLFSFDSNNEVDFSFLHFRLVDFVTTPCCFQAPLILCWGTGPPSSRQFSNFSFAFFFSFFGPTDPKSENSFDNKRVWGRQNFSCPSLVSFRQHWRGVQTRYVVEKVSIGNNWSGHVRIF